MHHITKSLTAMAVAAMLTPTMAWADGLTNTCKPDLNSNSSDTVMCTWPSDPSSNPQPDITDCQGMVRMPLSSADDCGNSDFRTCMEGKGFTCSDTQS